MTSMVIQNLKQPVSVSSHEFYPNFLSRIFFVAMAENVEMVGYKYHTLEATDAITETAVNCRTPL